MLNTCERHGRDHKYEIAPEKCEVVPPIYRETSQPLVKLYGRTLKEVDRYKYLGLPFGAKGLDTRRMCEVSIAKGIRTAGSSRQGVVPNIEESVISAGDGKW